MCCWPLAFLLPLVAEAQSGRDGNPVVDCFSDISLKHPNTLTCQLDIDDGEEKPEITLCQVNMPNKTCMKGELMENTVVFQQLDVMKKYVLRIQFDTGESFRQEYDLKTIIKPTSPWIISARYSEKSRTVPIYIGTHYKDSQLQDYLIGKLNFELEITSAQNTVLRTEVPYSTVIIEESHLRNNTDYSVRVRARPNGDYFKGTWSEWSPFTSFQTPTLQDPDASLLVYTLIAASVILLIFAMVIVRWHKMIKSSIWPRIPNPKNTLLQMYKPNKGVPISFNPEAFCDQIIHRVVRIEAMGIDLETPGTGLGSCEVKGHEWEGLTTWKAGDLDGLRFLLKPATEEKDGRVPQTMTQLDGSGGVRGGSWPKSPMSPATGRKEGAYITMSSIFNTQ